MKKIIIHAFLCGSLFTACKSGNEEKKTEDTYKKVTLTVEEMEKKEPIRFLSVTGGNRRNILGQTVIKGTIKNNAKIVAFKDVEIKLSFYSKTGALLEEDKETIFENIPPGESKNFKSKYFAAKGTDSVAMKVTGAKPQE